MNPFHEAFGMCARCGWHLHFENSICRVPFRAWNVQTCDIIHSTHCPRLSPQLVVMTSGHLELVSWPLLLRRTKQKPRQRALV